VILLTAMSVSLTQKYLAQWAGTSAGTSAGNSPSPPTIFRDGKRGIGKAIAGHVVDSVAENLGVEVFRGFEITGHALAQANVPGTFTT